METVEEHQLLKSDNLNDTNQKHTSSDKRDNGNVEINNKNENSETSTSSQCVIPDANNDHELINASTKIESNRATPSPKQCGGDNCDDTNDLNINDDVEITNHQNVTEHTEDTRSNSIIPSDDNEENKIIEESKSELGSITVHQSLEECTQNSNKDEPVNSITQDLSNESSSFSSSNSYSSSQKSISCDGSDGLDQTTNINKTDLFNNETETSENVQKINSENNEMINTNVFEVCDKEEQETVTKSNLDCLTKQTFDNSVQINNSEINEITDSSSSDHHITTNGSEDKTCLKEIPQLEKPSKHNLEKSETEILPTEISSPKQLLQNEVNTSVNCSPEKNQNSPNSPTIEPSIQESDTDKDDIVHKSNFDGNLNGNIHKTPLPQHDHNEDSSLSTNSSLSDRSIRSSTSSQHLVIDHPIIDDNDTLKVAPLKLSLKRRPSKSNVDIEPVSKQFILDDEHYERNHETITINNMNTSLLEYQELHQEEPLQQTPSKPCTVEKEEIEVITNFKQKFTCKYCSNLSFDSIPSLEQHYAICELNNDDRHDLSCEKKKPSRQFLKCSACKTVHSEFHFFCHIRDIHKRFICNFCYQYFPTVEKLALHLENRHDMDQIHFNNAKDLFKTNKLRNSVRNLTCCMCQHVFQSKKSFHQHTCSDFLQPCADCNQLAGRHTHQCKNNNITRKHAKKKLGNLHASFAVDAKSSPNPNNRPFDQQLLAASLMHHDIGNGSLSQNYDNDDDSDYGNNTSNIHLMNSDINMSIDTGTGSDNNNDDEEFSQSENNDETITEANEIDEEPPIPKLIIPKMMLRVPKEFQKSVDAEVSSSESEEFDDEIDPEDRNSSSTPVNEYTSPREDHDEHQWSDVDTRSATETITGEQQSLEELTKNSQLANAAEDPQNTDVDEESSDSTKANLKRILNEIERTKMEIQRTKNGALHNKQGNLSQSSCRESKGSTTEQRWSPTPPASPQPRSVSPRRTDNCIANNMNAKFDSNLAKSTTTPPNYLQNNDSKGSEVMDIDDTIHSDATTTNDVGVSECNKINQNMADVSANQMKSENEPTNDAINATESSNVSDLDTNNDMNGLKDSSIISKDVQKLPTESASTSSPATSQPLVADDGIEIANEDTVVVELLLDRPIDKFEFVDFVRLCLKAVYPLCLYCNHARRIAVNGKSLVLHMIAQHRFTGTVDSITAEELQIETIIAKLKSCINPLEFEYLNSTSYCTLGDGAFTQPFNERIYECFQCRFVTSTHKELYMHNRRLHLKTAILCFMCRSNFYSFSEILCHICPGDPSKTSMFEIKYRCCLCETTNLPSPFRLMVHLRKKHFACDICLEDCRDQSKLSSHVWKHKLHHLCYRCGIAYRNKQDITKHLYWKHGTESINCKRCLQKRWRHVYHFCIPPPSFVCEECNLCFSKAMYLEVHKRSHTGDFRYPCTEEKCEEIFISRRFLLKHTATHQIEQVQNAKSLIDVQDQGDQNSSEEKHNKLPAIIKDDVSNVDDDFSTSTRKKTNDDDLKDEENGKDEIDDKTKELASPDSIGLNSSQPNIEVHHKKRKKNKRSKELLEDLNLIAPNLSESDSCNESDKDYKSKGDDTILHLPNVMLSPSSESDNGSTENNTTNHQDHVADDAKNMKKDEDKVPDIWKNLLQANGNIIPDENIQSASMEAGSSSNSEELLLPIYTLHVCMSDHDYSKMHRPQTPPPTLATPTKKHANKHQSPMSKLEKKAAKNDSNSSRRKSDNLSSDSSSESSSSSDSSSCSCGSNCSCSSSDSQSSSSSSQDDSDSSSASVNSRKRQRKKSIRKKSASPQKQAHKLKIESKSPAIENKIDEENNAAINVSTVDNTEAIPNVLPFNESDLETNVSETDEEFYDEHPQKLANELLAQKRAALLAQTRLSPSHNYDIVENSRPSTPSLPEEVSTFGEKRTKLKKKKRERKSSNKVNQKISAHISDGVAMSMPMSTLINPEMIPSNAETIVSDLTSVQHPNSLISASATSFGHSQYPQTPINHQVKTTSSTLEREHIASLHYSHLSMKPVSEGSSCSDVDGTLKRSKRTRRPNKFYGYSSDDENMSTVLAPPLMVGMQLIKPQPPPQLTWAKEDLPAPSKSILNIKNKNPRLSKAQSTPQSIDIHNPVSGTTTSRKEIKRKKPSDAKQTPKNKKKPKDVAENSFSLPPIPTLKIRPSQLLAANNSDASSDSSSEEEEVDVNLFTSPQITAAHLQTTTATTTTALVSTVMNDLEIVKPTSSLPISSVIQTAPAPLPPVPETTVFNQKIPPALLPNPSFATLQYFKANNIRYPVRPPAGARLPREGEAVYCYCRCPYDEVSEMIACDGDNCLIEWFHFECVGIMVAPQGKWFCAECRPRYSEELYPSNKT